MYMTATAVVGAAIAVITVWWSYGVASAAPAPDVFGQKYSDASSTLQNAGFTAEVGSIVGDLVPHSDCIVTGQALDSLPSVGSKKYLNTAKKVRLTLNCNRLQATANSPGMSAGNPESQRLQDAANSVKK
jgi:beta-lactam-binding protein with PASTA domain